MKLTRTINAQLGRLFLIVASLNLPLVAGATPPPPHNVSAANLTVVQNDTGNTSNSVTVTPSLSINDFRMRPGSNRGDYNVQIGETPADDLSTGLVMVSVSENGRDNNEGTGVVYCAPAFDGTVYNGSNELQSGFWIVMQDCTTSRAEYNANCGVAFFRYTNWICGWARNATAQNGQTNDLFVASPGLVLGNHFKGIGAGKSALDLREFGIKNTDGVLIVNHAKNEGNFALSQTNADGTWTIYVKDNNGDNASYEQDPVAFVYIPSTNTSVISGRFMTDENMGTQILTHSGNTVAFEIVNIETGRWRLTIPGYAPTNGVLIVSAEGGLSLNRDNVVSYQPDGNGWIIESRDIVSGDNYPVLETPTNQPVASFVFIPAGSPGISYSGTNGLTTTEGGASAQFSVTLDCVPSADVTVPVNSSDVTEGTVSPSVLTFTPSNWNVPQTVTVTGVDDGDVDGSVSYAIQFGPLESEDVNYDGLLVDDVVVVNADNDQASISVTPTQGLVTTESGQQAVFQVSLNSHPAADVTINLHSSNPGEGNPNPSQLTFTAANWNVPQTVTIIPVDDGAVDGNVAYEIVTEPAVSADGEYNGMDADNVQVVNENSDVVSVNLTAGTNRYISVVEGSQVSVTYALGAKPSSAVTININSENTAKGTVSPSSIVFTPENWNKAQTVVLTGVDNAIQDGNYTYKIHSVIQSADAGFAALQIGDITATTIDNEAALTLSAGNCVYGLGKAPICVDGRADLADLDTVSFTGGSLTVSISNIISGDLLGISTNRNDGSLISVDGASVLHDGTAFGTVTGGSGGAPLVVSFNDKADVSAVLDLVRSVTFYAPTNTGSLRNRTVAFALNDGQGGLSLGGKTVRVGLLRLSQFQDGANHGYGVYTNEQDIVISQEYPDIPYPMGRNTKEGLLVDYSEVGSMVNSQVLIRFDDLLGTNEFQIPTNSLIVSAELLVHVNNSGNGGVMFRMLVPWDSETSTWNTFGGGIEQNGVDSEIDYYSQWNVQAGTGLTDLGTVSIGVTEDVQAWIKGTNNYGWVIRGWPFNTDGTAFSPSEATDINTRPCLRVYWLPEGEAGAKFRQGVDDYNGVHDTRIRANAPDTANSAVNPVYVDYAVSGSSDEEQCLIRFDDIVGNNVGQIPSGARIDAAVLVLASVASNATGNGGHLHSLLVPWDDATCTWNTWVDGIQADGIEAAVTPTVTAGVTNLTPKVQGGFNSYEVTSDVQAWVNGTNNYGWVWLPWKGGSDGWAYATSEDATERNRPCLRVFYSVVPDAPATPVIKSIQQNGLRIDMVFSGTAGKTYQVLRATSVNGTWSPVGNVTVASDGSGRYTEDTTQTQTGFYRIVYP